MRFISDGNACFFIIANAPLGGGKVPAGTTLLSGALATRFSSSVTAWRWVLREYFATLVSSSLGATFCSFPGIPREVPWAVTYSRPESTALKAKEWDLVQVVARLAAVRLCDECARASLAAERGGKDFTPEPEEYPELR
jgi:hypothetical protein